MVSTRTSEIEGVDVCIGLIIDLEITGYTVFDVHGVALGWGNIYADSTDEMIRKLMNTMEEKSWIVKTVGIKDCIQYETRNRPPVVEINKQFIRSFRHGAFYAYFRYYKESQSFLCNKNTVYSFLNIERRGRSSRVTDESKIHYAEFRSKLSLSGSDKEKLSIAESYLIGKYVFESKVRDCGNVIQTECGCGMHQPGMTSEDTAPDTQSSSRRKRPRTQ